MNNNKTLAFAIIYSFIVTCLLFHYAFLNIYWEKQAKLHKADAVYYEQKYKNIKYKDDKLIQQIKTKNCDINYHLYEDTDYEEIPFPR